MPDLRPTCPAARLEGEGITCQLMEEDQRRADSVMEGAPVGTHLTLRENASIILGFCCGTDDPPLDPPGVYEEVDAGKRERVPQSHVMCPVWLANYERGDLKRRLFGDLKRPPESADGVGPERVTEEDLAWLEGEAVG